MGKIIDMSFDEEDAKRILNTLKGDLIRSNNMNFQYLSKITNIGLYIEDRLRDEDVI